MTKELSELLKRMKEKLLHSEGITLTKKDLSLIIKYINELEIEISGVDEDNY